MPIEWFARINEQEQGPFTPKELRALVQEGKIGPDSLVRQASMQHWAYAKHIQGLIAGAREVARPAPPSVSSGANTSAAHGKAAPAPVPERPEQWFCKSVDDQEFGPYAMAQLKQFAKQGRITTSTLLRRGPDGQWIPAQSVEGILAAQAPTTPPVMPSPAPPVAPPQVLQLPVTPNPNTGSPQTSSNRTTIFGIGSIALGCLGFLTFWIPVIGVGIITTGLVLGIAGIRLGRKQGRGGIGLSIAGTVISAIIFVPTALFWGFALLLIGGGGTSHNTSTPHIPQPAPNPQYAQREPESPKQEGLGIPEPLNWNWVLAAFGPDSEVSGSQKTALFEHVKGKMLEVTGTWKSDTIRGARIRPAGFSQDVNVPWVSSEADYVKRIRDGDMICVVGRLTDYPGVLSSFVLSNCEFQKNKCERAFDSLPESQRRAILASEEASTPRMKPKTSEPLSWKWVESTFGRSSKLSSDQKTAEFDSVKGKLLEVSGTWNPRGYVMPEGVTLDVSVSLSPGDQEYAKLIQAGEQVIVEGRLTDFPGVFSRFTLENATFLRNKFKRAFDGLSKDEQQAILDTKQPPSNLPTVKLWNEKASDKLKRDVDNHKAGVLLTVESHPSVVREAVQRGEIVWELENFASAVASRANDNTSHTNTYLIFGSTGKLTAIVEKNIWEPESITFASAYGFKNPGRIVTWIRMPFDAAIGVEGRELRTESSVFSGTKWSGNGNESSSSLDATWTLDINGSRTVHNAKVNVNTIPGYWKSLKNMKGTGFGPGGEPSGFEKSDANLGEAHLVKLPK